jgi:hypothetical protein
VPEPSRNQIREALQFSRFRFKLIEFLKLPFDIDEPALREVLERTCCGVHRNYLARAERVEEILKFEDTLPMNVQTGHSSPQARIPKAAALVFHAAKLDERGHPFPKKVAVLEWHEPIRWVDG